MWSPRIAPPVSAAVNQPWAGVSQYAGTKTELPLFTVWSTPWSKNWPKKVNQELYAFSCTA